MKRLLMCLAFLAVAGCSRPLDREKARARLVEQAGDVCRAMLDGDHRRLAELTHHNVLEGVGGKGKFIERREDLVAEIRRDGGRCTSILIGEPSEIVEAGREVYASVPTQMRLARRDGARGNKPSFLIAASRDGGANWVFVDGDSVGDDRARLRQMLPNAPDRLPLKPAVGAIWEE